jgi:hypothetical protein
MKRQARIAANNGAMTHQLMAMFGGLRRAFANCTLGGNISEKPNNSNVLQL